MSLGGKEKTDDLNQSKDEAELRSFMGLAQKGDAQSYKTLLLRLNKLMTAFVHNSFSRFGFDQVSVQEEIVQEILLAIHSKRNTYDPSQFFLPWVYAIARYKMIDYMRRSGLRGRMTVPIDDEIETIAAVQAHPIGTDVDVLALCDSLPAKQRDILKLVKLEGLSVAEVSARTGFSASDIKVSVHRALKTLQERIKEVDHEY